MEIASQKTENVAPLFSPEFQRDPYPTYRQHLRGPTLQPLVLRPGVWMVFRYEACARILRDPRLSSVRPAAQLVAVDAAALSEFDELVRHMGRWLLMKDAPRHPELRKLMNRGFTPAVAEALGPRVEAIIERLLDDIEGETFDLIKAAGAGDLRVDGCACGAARPLRGSLRRHRSLVG